MFLCYLTGTHGEDGHTEAKFHFGALGCLKLGALLECMSYKLALHVHVVLTEKVVTVHNHITLFSIPSIPGTTTVKMTLMNSGGVITFPLHGYSVLQWPRVI